MRHKEFADPSMLDNMEGLVYADMELNMKTAKKVKAFFCAVDIFSVVCFKYTQLPLASITSYICLPDSSSYIFVLQGL